METAQYKPETSNERYLRHFRDSGWFFASNNEMFEWAKEQPFLKPLTDLVPNGWNYSFIPIEWNSIEDLSRVFSFATLNSWDIYSLNNDYQI